MKRVIVASTNPAKIAAARTAFAAMFPDDIFDITGVDAESGVSSQPWGDDETLRGAWNRVNHAQKLAPAADYYVSNESGIKEQDNDLFITNWIAITDGTRRTNTSTASFMIPTDVAHLVRQGTELGPAFEQVFGAEAAKRGAGGVGKLTHGNIPREQLVAQAMITALIPFKNPELYK